MEPKSKFPPANFVYLDIKEMPDTILVNADSNREDLIAYTVNIAASPINTNMPDTIIFLIYAKINIPTNKTRTINPIAEGSAVLGKMLAMDDIKNNVILMAKEMTAATIWFSVKEETISPMARSTSPNNQNAKMVA